MSPIQSIENSSPPSKRRLWAEVLIVLGLSLGASAVYSIVTIIDRTTQAKPLSEQTATVAPSLSDRQIYDFIYQFLGNFFNLVPVVLVGFLLWRSTRPHLGRLGIDFTRPWRDTAAGFGLALAVGIPGLGVYALGHLMGITVNVRPSEPSAYWWTIPMLIFTAVRAGVTEEVIVVGYLFARLGDLGWGRWTIILSTALLRGTYHLYQGFGSFVGNVAMGILFGWLYTRYRRLLPLVIAHVIIDVAAFVGYQWAATTFSWLFS